MENKQEPKYYVYMEYTDVEKLECGHTSPKYEMVACDDLQKAYHFYQVDPLHRKVLKEIKVGVIVTEDQDDR